MVLPTNKLIFRRAKYPIMHIYTILYYLISNLAHTYGTQWFPFMFGGIGRFASGRGGRRLCGQAFATGCIETGPFCVVFFHVERLTRH